MFYAHFEGRKAFAIRAFEGGLRGGIFNLIYPPDTDDVSAAKGRDAEVMVNPQTFRLPYPPDTWNPKLHLLLDKFGQQNPSDLAEITPSGRVTALNDKCRKLCRDFLRAQDAYAATDIIAPYFHARAVSDPWFEIGLQCAHYIDSICSKNVIAGVMLDVGILSNRVDFEQFANALTSPDAPSNQYFDFGLNSTPKRPLRNAETLSLLRELFDALHAAEKFSLLGRCNIEGLLLRASSGLDAFSSSYYQTERQGVIGRLDVDYEMPSGFMAPTPFVFSSELLTDLPRPLVQRLLNEDRTELFRCDCGQCDELLSRPELVRAGALAPTHYMLCLSALDEKIEEDANIDERAASFYDRVIEAQDLVNRIGRAAVPAGTFSHLGAWASWLEDQFGYGE